MTRSITTITVSENEHVYIEYDGQCRIEFVADDQMYAFMNPHPSSGSYWASKIDGTFTLFPLNLKPDSPGKWHVVITNRTNANTPQITVR